MDYYNFIKKKQTITFAEALEIFVPIFVKVHKWNAGDNLIKVRNDKHNLLKDLLVKIVEHNKAQGNIHYDWEYDEYGRPKIYGFEEPEQVVYLNKSYVNAPQLYSYIAHYLDCYGYVVPDELNILNGISDSINKIKNDPYSKHDDQNYPKYDDLDIDNPDPKLLQELKKKYGELRSRKIEWDESLPVATKIGIEFYEEGLRRDVDRDTFKSEVYKKYSNLYKTTIDKIFEALPPSFRSKGKRVEVNSGIDDETVDRIIDASIAAGFWGLREGVAKNATELKDRLEMDGIDLPPDTYLNSIAGKAKRFLKRFK